MKIATIVVNYNSENDTINFVNALSAYNSIEKIVVVDNKSTTIGAFEKIEKLRSNKVEVLQSGKNGGYNYGINYGIKHLEKNNEKYDCYLVSNSDIKIEEEAIEKCAQILEQMADAGIVAPRMYNKNNKPIRRSSWKIRTFWRDIVHSTRLLELIFYRVLRNGEYSDKDYKKEILEVEAISGSCFMIRADAVNKIGYFDENVFLFYEEDILAKQMKDNGYKVICVNSQKFTHYESQTIGKTFSYFTKMVKLFKSKIYFQKNYNKVNILGLALYYILFFFRILELIIEIPLRKLLKK